MGVSFDKKSAERISDVVRRVENSPFGQMPYRNNHKPRGGGSSDYFGPWAVIEKNATTVTIKAQDATNGYLGKSLMVAGLTTKEQTTDVDVTITTTGAVYVQIMQSGGTYSFTFANAALPAQTAGNLYVALTYVTFASSAITGLQQAQYGQIHVAGRVV